MKLQLANRSIYNCLELAAAKNEYIETELRHRKLGKTTALIQFAKENGYVVLVGSVNEADFLTKELGYRFKSINSRTLDGFPPFVFDESVTRKQIEKIKESGHIIITGFIRSEDFYRI
ncbi:MULTISPECIES: hypothetical protein [unclassified Virgibacillus]|uniref:hypothetical protein n=1 Tax=unclassified Virgibacillus TaxID=2620237 RepID=UPI00090AC30A|nr:MULTISPECIES: hypothetical protein [unclassified Virgibacillus]API92708.1 hypothetical protein BKP57_13370 [Virgibacillus sp. 6R]MBS7428204.1 hypothetical protein [Virgibacillus sp. 19R1-5]